MGKVEETLPRAPFPDFFRCSPFEFVSDFAIRISDFHGGPCPLLKVWRYMAPFASLAAKSSALPHDQSHLLRRRRNIVPFAAWGRLALPRRCRPPRMAARRGGTAPGIWRRLA